MTAEDRWLSAWLAASLAAAAVLFAVNAAFFHYTGISYFPRECWWMAFVALDLAVFGHFVRAKHPYAAFVATSLAFYALIAAVMGVLTTGIQLTPFPRIDAALARADAALGWDTVAALEWTAARPALRRLLVRCYDSIELQLALAPFVAAWAHDKRRLRVLLYATVYSSFAGSLFYYFFPSSGPASVFTSDRFMAVQRLTYLKYQQVHNFQPVTTLLGGLIAFPSFHVAWSALATYACSPRRPLLLAAAALNAVVIASTVLLGWHYLVDVPAGLALAGAALWAGEVTYRRLGS